MATGDNLLRAQDAVDRDVALVTYSMDRISHHTREMLSLADKLE
ncbi:MAG: hypothetical protein ACI8XX_001162 [Polaribacter sp.]|jgi:hypothetical protein